MNVLLKLCWFTIGITIFCGGVAVLVFPDSPHASCSLRMESARELFRSVDEACWFYFTEHDGFPPGDGTGSAELVRALREKSGWGRPYLEIPRSMIGPGGDLLSPLHPDAEVVRYRNNYSAGRGTRAEFSAQVPRAFELWCSSCDGREEGMNNWEVDTRW